LEASGKVLSFRAPRGLGTDLDWLSAAMITTSRAVRLCKQAYAAP